MTGIHFVMSGYEDGMWLKNDKERARLFDKLFRQRQGPKDGVVLERDGRNNVAG
jgi:hypothetical protein